MSPHPDTLVSVAVDFDGVIHRYSKGWHDNTIYDPPMPGAFAALAEMVRKGYAPFILTARPAEDVIAWCRLNSDLAYELVPETTRYWDVPNTIGVTNRKLPARFYIDDRAIRFTNWLDTLNYLR